MNNQQQVDKKRHGSKMRSKSLNVTATSLIFPFFSRNSEASIKREKEREREWHAYKRKKRERSVKEKRMEFFFSATAIEIESSREHVQLKR